MCVGDWRLGRFIRSVTTAIAVVGADIKVCGRSPQRVGIWFGVTAAGETDTVWFGTGGANGQIACVANPFTGLVRFTIKDDGDIPMREFWLKNDGVTGGIILTEFFLPEEILQEGIDRYNSGYKP